jgi:hypothetical protein
VVLNSAEAKQRAVAAWVLGYAPDKKSVLNELELAARDPDDTVRNNAIRAIGAILELGNSRPELGIKVKADLFIEMLDSVTWSDRNKATMVLLKLTEKKDAAVLAKIKKRSVDALVEMARWKARHGVMALTLLGRSAGYSETEIKEAWSKGERERIIRRAIAK